MKASTLSSANASRASREIKLSLSELTEALARLSRGQVLAVCIALVCAIGTTDYLTDYEVSMAM